MTTAHENAAAARAGGRRFRGIVAVAALLFHALAVVTLALTSPFPAPIDELAHYSYVVESGQAGALMPAFPEMRLWDPDTGAWTERPNHLGHPSPYYHLMAGLAAAAGPAGSADDARIVLLRLGNAGLSLLGLALVLAAGLPLFSGRAEQLVFAAATVTFPALGVLGGLINNDNLAWLAAGVVFFGLAHGGQRSHWWAAAGVLIAGWTKLTAFLMVAATVALWELIAAWTAGKARIRTRHLWLGGAMLAGVVPYLWNWVTYGAPVYTASEFYAALVAERGRVVLDFAGYTVLFFKAFALTWAALEPSNAVQMAGFAAALVLIALGLRHTAGRRGAQAGGRATTRTAALALGYAGAVLVVLPLHFGFGWSHYQETGHLIASYSRYYYALWPGLAVAFALSVPGLTARAARSSRAALAWPGLWILALALMFFATIQFVIIMRDGLGAVTAWLS